MKKLRNLTSIIRAQAKACYSSIFFFVFFLCTLPVTAIASDGTREYITGGFEMNGYLSAGVGGQHNIGGSPTEFAYDGSTAGVIGSMTPYLLENGTLTNKINDFQYYVEVLELDIAKHFGERASIVGHLWMGRLNSGSWVGLPAQIEQAYLTVLLSKKYNVNLAVGRYLTSMGFEPPEPYNQQTISWSILTRAHIFGLYSTGLRLSADITDHFSAALNVANGVVADWTYEIKNVPAFYPEFKISWGEDARKNTFLVIPFIDPASQHNNKLVYGVDSVLTMWPTDRFQIGLEADWQRDNSNGGPVTNYAGGLINLRYNFRDDLCGILKYAFVRQFAPSNGYLNLTGTKQNINEFSIGGIYMVADTIKLKLEARADYISPAGSRSQWVPGAAMGLATAF